MEHTQRERERERNVKDRTLENGIYWKRKRENRKEQIERDKGRQKRISNR